MKIKSQRSIDRKPLILSLLIFLICVFAGYGIYAHYARIWPFATQAVKSDTSAVEPEYSPNDPKNKSGQSSSLDRGDTVVKDTAGEDASVDTSSSTLSSPKGMIVVSSPGKNSLLTNGSVIAGTSSYDMVYFRIYDDNVGRIAEGSLEVKNGKFSGAVSLDSKGSTGTINIFYRLDDGNETETVSIPVRFK